MFKQRRTNKMRRNEMKWSPIAVGENSIDDQQEGYRALKVQLESIDRPVKYIVKLKEGIKAANESQGAYYC